MEPDRVNVYCGGDAPWGVDDTGRLRIPSAQMIRDDTANYGDVARSFDWWMSRICMPNATDFNRAVSFASGQPYEAASGPDSALAASDGNGDSGGDRQAKAEALFEDCWSSSWYEKDTLAAGEPLYAWSTGFPEPVPISAKLVFCFCAAPYTQDELWPKVIVFANWAKWFACAMACFFLLTFFMESYLLRFQRKRLDQYLDAAASWEEGGLVGGIMHISSSNLKGSANSITAALNSLSPRVASGHTDSGRARTESELVAAANSPVVKRAQKEELDKLNNALHPVRTCKPLPASTEPGEYDGSGQAPPTLKSAVLQTIGAPPPSFGGCGESSQELPEGAPPPFFFDGGGGSSKTLPPGAPPPPVAASPAIGSEQSFCF